VILENFVPYLKKSIAILSPIDYLIVKYQKDSVPVSEVYDDLLKMRMKYEELKSVGAIAVEECTYIMKLIDSRGEFLLGDAHYIGYLLDPRYLGRNLPAEKKREVMNMISKFPVSISIATTPEQGMLIISELTVYFTVASDERMESSPIIMSINAKKMFVLDFWKVHGGYWPMLRQIAMNVFTLATSSAAFARNFSTVGNVHTKVRNCMSGEKVNELVYIKTNMDNCPLNTLDKAIEEECEIIGDDEDYDAF
jgi:hAT family C-terminal dimerisation region